MVYLPTNDKFYFTGMDFKYLYQLPAEPSSLRTLAFGVKYPNGNNLLHQFVLNYSRPDNSSVQNYINGVLRSLSGIPANTRNRDGFTALHLAVRKRNYLMVKNLISCLPGIDVNAISLRNRRTALHFAILLLGDGGSGFPEVVYHTTLPVEVVQEITSIIEFLISRRADLKAFDCDHESPLHKAVRSTHLQTVQLLVEKGSPVEFNQCYHSPLYIAVQRDQADLVQFLISRGANVNKNANDGDTPLYKAAQINCWEMVKILVDNGAVVHTYNRNSRFTPLHLAVMKGNKDIFFYLIDRCWDLKFVTYKNKIGNAPLHDAVAAKCLEIVKKLVERGADVNVKNRNSDTPLHLAALLKQIEIVKFLINSGGNLNAVNKFGCVPLHNAVATLDNVKVLVQSNAIVDFKDYNGNTPLNWAVMQKEFDTVIFLIESGGDLNAVNTIGDSPLHNAVREESLKTVKVLVEAGAELNIRNSVGYTPLHIAAEGKQIKIAKLLINSGADVDAKNDKNDTPLHCAAKRRHIKTVKFLIDNGANLNAVGNQGKTPLHCALRYTAGAKTERFEVAKTLVEGGAVVDYGAGYYRTLLALAKKLKRTEIIEFLHSHKRGPGDVRKFSYDETPSECTPNRQKGKSNGGNSSKRLKLEKP